MAVSEVNLFISHSWTYSTHYDRLCEWIFDTTWRVDDVPIRFVNRSVPKDDPIHNAPTVDQLRLQIYRRIAASDVVVIPMGMYASYSKWIQREIDGANLYKKPILAVDPWGQRRSSSVVRDAAANEVGWTSEGVVRGIWTLHTRR